MKKTLLLATLVAASTLSANAFAGQGFVRAEIGTSDIELRSGPFRESESDTAVTIGGGYWFNPNFAIEGHAGSLYNEDLGFDQELDLVSIGVGLAAKKNFGADGHGFYIGGRAGFARLTAQVREDTFDVLDDESSTKPYYGVSVGYDINERWGLSLNADRRKAEFNGVDLKVDTVTLGGEFRF